MQSLWALRNGATPNEVIDALLMAFPVLGLAKIVWATDILLDKLIEGARAAAPELAVTKLTLIDRDIQALDALQAEFRQLPVELGTAALGPGFSR